MKSFFTRICFGLLLLLLAEIANGKKYFDYTLQRNNLVVLAGEISQGSVRIDTFYANIGDVLILTEDAGTGQFDNYGPFYWYLDTSLIQYSDSLIITQSGLYGEGNSKNAFLRVIYQEANGIAELGNDVIMPAYPNPFTQTTNILVGTVNEKFDFQLFDVCGRLMREITDLDTEQFQVSRDNLPAGVYPYVISAGNKRLGYGKLVIE
ncbi:MAG: hypothetical protein JWO06_830 [Bacteroidota bacterium]|nr:hypothetical protein [Bacteroidota bacterium]